MRQGVFLTVAAICGVLLAQDFPLEKYGAVGDGTFDCTRAFGQAIDAAHAAGGGRVTVPAGTWFTGPIHLKSNVELHVDDAATVRFTGDPEAYRPLVRSSFAGIECYALSPLVHAQGCTNVAVTGGGLFTPVMDTWRIWFDRNTPEMLAAMGQLYAWGEGDEPVENRRASDLPGARFRPCFFEFENCRNVRLEGFRIRQSPLWTVNIRLCQDVVVRGLDIFGLGHNNDGVDICSSKRVLIEDCSLEQGDDGFVIKSGRDRDGRRVNVPTEDVEIRRCVLREGHTLIAIGSEVSGGIRNVTLHDCRVEGVSSRLVSIKTSDRKGGFIENIVVSNVLANAVRSSLVGIRTNIDFQWGKYPARERILTRIDGIHVSNVWAASVPTVYEKADDPRLPATNVTLENVRAGGEPPDLPGALFAIPHRVEPDDAARALLGEVYEKDRNVDWKWRDLPTREALEKKAKETREAFLASIGRLPERTPLNARVVVRIPRAGYAIEKIVFESRPGVFVPSLLFLPDSPRWKPPYHAILLPCGHSKEGKAAPGYQRGALMAALQGFAVFIPDPIAQGERAQEASDPASSVMAHLKIGAYAALLGQNFAAIRAWDGIRALDYLESRPDIVKGRFGCMGNSGGGTMTSFMSVLDPRIAASAPSCYLGNLRSQLEVRRAPDAEQIVFGQLTFGLNHLGLVLAGGHPVRMHCSNKDFIPFDGSLQTYRTVNQLAERFYPGEDRYGLTVSVGPHGWKESSRTSSIAWMRRWLRGEKDALPIDEAACQALDVGFDMKTVDAGLPVDEVQIAPNGCVRELPGYRSVHTYLDEDCAVAASTRAKPRTSAERATEIARLAGIRAPRENLPFLPLQRLVAFKLEGDALVVSNNGKGLRLHYFLPEEDGEIGVACYVMGTSLVARRAEEILQRAVWEKRRTGRPLRLVADGRAAIPVAHARAVRPDLFAAVEYRNPPPSWVESLQRRLPVSYADLVNGALLTYDWSDLK